MIVRPRAPLVTPEEADALARRRSEAVGRMPFGTFLLDHPVKRLPCNRPRRYSASPGRTTTESK